MSGVSGAAGKKTAKRPAAWIEKVPPTPLVVPTGRTIRFAVVMRATWIDSEKVMAIGVSRPTGMFPDGCTSTTRGEPRTDSAPCVGAAGSTGRGEANLYNLCSFLIVEQMRLGKSPKDAGMEALKRIQKNTVEKRLLNARGLPNFGINFYIVNKKGEYAGVSMYAANYAVCTENGPQTLPCEALLEGRANS